MLSSTASLYKPAAFGGAEILDPWECMAEYRARLLEAGADMVLPLCHLYEFQVLTQLSLHTAVHPSIRTSGPAGILTSLSCLADTTITKWTEWSRCALWSICTE